MPVNRINWRLSLKQLIWQKKWCNQSKEKLNFLQTLPNASANMEAMNALKELVIYCKENNIIQKEGIVGAQGIKQTFVSSLNVVLKTALKTFETVEEAKNWLVQ